jgi:hypothetical protein
VVVGGDDERREPSGEGLCNVIIWNDSLLMHFTVRENSDIISRLSHVHIYFWSQHRLQRLICAYNSSKCKIQFYLIFKLRKETNTTMNM